jgi:uncharacterized membrane protein HdeD (DUF308 family)
MATDEKSGPSEETSQGTSSVAESAPETEESEGAPKWLWYIFGALCIIGGLVALFRRAPTVLVLASVLGFLLLVIGVFWIIEAFATMQTDNFWWLGLIAGILALGLGFWTSRQPLVTQAFTLLVVAGLWALLHGITDIVKAFQIKRLGGLPAAA